MSASELWTIALVALALATAGWRSWREIIDSLCEAIDNFRGGPPRPMHPSPAADSAFVRRRRAKRAHSNS